jgi:hypothetical protein
MTSIPESIVTGVSLKASPNRGVEAPKRTTLDTGSPQSQFKGLQFGLMSTNPFGKEDFWGNQPDLIKFA